MSQATSTKIPDNSIWRNIREHFTVQVKDAGTHAIEYEFLDGPYKGEIGASGRKSFLHKYEKVF